MTITVYSRPDCVQCTGTGRRLDRGGTTYRTVDLAQDESALTFVKGLGHQQAPVVVVTDERGEVVQHWSGLRLDLIDQLVTAQPALSAA